MTAERKPLDVGLVTLNARTFCDRIHDALRRHAITHVALELDRARVAARDVDVGVVMVFALRDTGDGSADVIACVVADVADDGVDRIVVELDRLADERERASRRVVLMPCPRCLTIGAVTFCDECGGAGFVES